MELGKQGSRQETENMRDRERETERLCVNDQ